MTMEDDILIDNYLKGLLSKDEEQSFLDRLQSDIEFNEKFKLEKQLFNALNEDSWSFVEGKNAEFEAYKKDLEGDDLQNLKKTLTQVNSEFNSISNRGYKRLFYYLAAASVIVFLGFQFFFNQSLSNLDLYKEYIGLDDLPSFVSRSNDINDLIRAQELFESEKYGDALMIFNSQVDLADNTSDLFIYKGISEMELNRYDEAEQTFNALISSELLDAPKGYWYKALLSLKSDRVEEAIDILTKIVTENLFNKSKAEELLKELE